MALSSLKVTLSLSKRPSSARVDVPALPFRQECALYNPWRFLQSNIESFCFVQVVNEFRSEVPFILLIRSTSVQLVPHYATSRHPFDSLLFSLPNSPDDDRADCGEFGWWSDFIQWERRLVSGWFVNRGVVKPHCFRRLVHVSDVAKGDVATQSRVMIVVRNLPKAIQKGIEPWRKELEPMHRWEAIDTYICYTVVETRRKRTTLQPEHTSYTSLLAEDHRMLSQIWSATMQVTLACRSSPLSIGYRTSRNAANK